MNCKHCGNESFLSAQDFTVYTSVKHVGDGEFVVDDTPVVEESMMDDALRLVCTDCGEILPFPDNLETPRIAPAEIKIDWKLLADQKLTLVKMDDERLNTEERDAIRGIVHLLDALQDRFEPATPAETTDRA